MRSSTQVCELTIADIWVCSDCRAATCIDFFCEQPTLWELGVEGRADFQELFARVDNEVERVVRDQMEAAQRVATEADFNLRARAHARPRPPPLVPVIGLTDSDGDDDSVLPSSPGSTTVEQEADSPKTDSASEQFSDSDAIDTNDLIDMISPLPAVGRVFHSVRDQAGLESSAQVWTSDSTEVAVDHSGEGTRYVTQYSIGERFPEYVYTLAHIPSKYLER